VALATWTLFEIEYHRGGVTERPVTEELEAQGRLSERAQAIGALKLLKAHGWPGAKMSLEFEKVGYGIWQLKCKPGCWRLFVHVSEKDHSFLLLHSFCKKAQKRKAKRRKDDSDTAIARLYDYQTGKASRREVSL
jgi:phage-related protein